MDSDQLNEAVNAHLHLQPKALRSPSSQHPNTGVGGGTCLRLLPRGPPRAAPCPAERRGAGTSAEQGAALAGCPSRPAPPRPPGPALTVQAGEAQRPLGSSRPPARLKGPAPPSSARGGRGDSSPVPGAGRAGTPFTASACKWEPGAERRWALRVPAGSCQRPGPRDAASRRAALTHGVGMRRAGRKPPARPRPPQPAAPAFPAASVVGSALEPRRWPGLAGLSAGSRQHRPRGCWQRCPARGSCGGSRAGSPHGWAPLSCQALAPLPPTGGFPTKPPAHWAAMLPVSSLFLAVSLYFTFSSPHYPTLSAVFPIKSSHLLFQPCG